MGFSHLRAIRNATMRLQKTTLTQKKRHESMLQSEPPEKYDRIATPVMQRLQPGLAMALLALQLQHD